MDPAARRQAPTLSPLQNAGRGAEAEPELARPDAMSHTRRHLVRLAAVAAFTVLIALPAVALPQRDVARTTPDGAAGSSQEAARPAAGTRAPRAGATLPGIDVSHWQGDVDWTKVAEDGIRFVFLKATDGTHYVDPTFAANRAGARANGLSVGAYHFARPDAAPGDARREARHFIDVMDPRPGDLLPVLDMETSEGLDQEGVTRWARTWIRVVRDLSGVTPLVYTSPYGWASRTGDTRLVARDGAPLWVAHWGVRTPTLPADGWDGRGWVVWQHSSTGHVSGIAGNVDLDRLAGSRLGVITIRRLTLEVTGGAGRVTSTPAGRGCADSCTHNVDPDASVTLTAVPDDQAYFVGWSGACAGAGTICTVTMRSSRTVGARFVTDITPPTATVTPPTGLTDAAIVRFDERVRDADAPGLVLREAAGDRVAIRRVCRSDSGVPVGCDTAAVRSASLRPVSPLVPGRTYEVAVNGGDATPRVRDRVGNPAAAASVAFEAARSVESSSPAVRRAPAGAWMTVRAERASHGRYLVTRRAGASVRLTFDGPGVDWIAVAGPDRGRAQIFVDGTLLRTVDLYADTRTFDVLERIDGLADGRHELRIVGTGRARPAATGTAVTVDRLIVHG